MRALLKPLSFRNDSVGTYRAAMIVDHGEIRYTRTALMQDLRSFARTWDRSLRAQGYLRVVTGK